MSLLDNLRFFDTATRGATRGARRLREMDLPEVRWLRHGLRPGSIKDALRSAPRRDVRALLAAVAVGVGLAYLLDPQSGRRRRKVGRDRVAAAVRGAARASGRLARRTASDSYGVAQKIRHRESEGQTDLDDATLAQKVQTEIFRDPDVPKGRVNVNVERGTVVLRGELDRSDQIAVIEEEARRIAGVRDVKNLIRLSVNAGPDREGWREGGGS